MANPIFSHFKQKALVNSSTCTPLKANSLTSSRIESIDLLRGIVMIIMALDHVRGYLHFESLIFSPTDLQQTTLAIFFTRSVTYLCAPTFIFLAGTSAYFIVQRKTAKETSFFLLTRGLWLIVLQFTLIRFGWNFDPFFHYNSSNIISTIGFCMMALSLLIHLRFKLILIIGLVMVAGHNLLDRVSFESGTLADVVWSFLHMRKFYTMSHDYSFQFLYPIIPWVGVMALGYCLGRLYDGNFSVEKRRKIMLQLGATGILFFFILRWINVYGDPLPWAAQLEVDKTVISFFNVEKYPPSLLFLCLTLGIALVLLGILEGRNLYRFRPIILYGKVALFYYVVHIFVIHAVALGAAMMAGYPWQTMIFIGSSAKPSPLLIGNFGFSLLPIYMIWISVVVFLYPFCRSWNSLKLRNKTKWWVSYV
jgi:uncharacterized membrane protein